MINTKKEIRFFTVSSISLVLLIGVIFILMNIRIGSAIEKVKMTGEMELDINELRMVTYEVITYDDEMRPSTEWVFRYDNITHFLLDNGIDKEVNFFTSYRDIRNSFDKLLEINNKKDSIEREVFLGRQRIVINDLFYRLQKNADFANEMHYRALHDLNTIIKYKIFFDTLFTIIIVLSIGFASFYMVNKILSLRSKT